MREKFQRFMQGRYGNDGLNNFLLFFAIFIIIINMIFFRRMPKVNSILSGVETVLVILALIRTFSRNYQARSRENQKYMAVKDKIMGLFGKKGSSGNSYNRQNTYNSYQQQQAARNAGYRIFKCPNCKQKIRVPSGKGRIEISCPKCQTRFIKKS